MSTTENSENNNNSKNLSPQFSAGAVSSVIIMVFTLTQCPYKEVFIVLTPITIAGIVYGLTWFFAFKGVRSIAELRVNGSLDRQIADAKKIIKDPDMPPAAIAAAEEKLNELVKLRLSTNTLRMQAE